MDKLILATLPLTSDWHRMFYRDPFSGIYHATLFDYCILVPYFVALIVLSVYGIHRYFLTCLYLRRKSRTPKPSGQFEQLPRVTIQLPIFNERYVVERLIKSICRIDYPHELLDIQVLDDSTDETRAICSRLVGEYAGAGYPITYIHRENREGFKAGALDAGLKRAKGEFVAIFDADFEPPPKIIQQMVHYFTDPKVAVVQGRWTWINRHYSYLSEVEAIMLDGHFVIEHAARNFSGRFINFNGTAGMWRRSAIDDAGGWQHDTLTEDTDLSYRAQLKGWKFIYDPAIECPSELPVEMNSFRTQQARWAKGLTQVAKKLLLAIWRSRQPLYIKIEATLHLTANISYPLMVLFSVILLPALIVRFYQGWFQMLYLDLPLFLASTCSVNTFYIVAQRELYPQHWLRQVKYMPFLMAAGIGLSISNSKAVIEALVGIQSSFVRTPKYHVEGIRAAWEGKKYVRRKTGWVPLIELGLAVYFILTTVYSVEAGNYFTVPFLVLFLTGYSYMGTMSLFQTPLLRAKDVLAEIVRPRGLQISTSHELSCFATQKHAAHL